MWQPGLFVLVYLTLGLPDPIYLKPWAHRA